MHRLPLPHAVEPSELLMRKSATGVPAPAVGKRIESEFSVLTPRGHVNCVLTEPLQRPDVEQQLRGLLVLVHAPPLGDSVSPPLAGLANALHVGTVRVDLTGCGKSSGEPICDSVDRDADDLRHVVEHLRHSESVERLKARAKGAVPASGPTHQAVLGIVGVGGGGTAAVRYAALNTADPLPFIATISARVSHAFALRGTLTWSQIDAMKAEDSVEITLPAGPPPQPRHTLRVTPADYDASPDLSGAGGSGSNFLVLHGSLDKAVPPSEAVALDALLREGGSSSCELRVIPGMGSDSELVGHEATLAYAISDWIWRRTMHASSDQEYAAVGGEAPSGFNIFVDDLSAKVREIHAGTRINLPSIDNGTDDEADEEDDE